MAIINYSNQSRRSLLSLVLRIQLEGKTIEKEIDIGDLIKPQETNKKLNLVGFWHIGPNFQPRESITDRDHFARIQSDEILRTWLFSEEGTQSGEYDIRVNYVTTLPLADVTKENLERTGQIHELVPTAIERDPGIEYLEFPTLAEVYSFCRKPENEDAIAFYMHTKSDDNTRLGMEGYMLGKSCLACMKDENKIACGPNYEGTNNYYWNHFSGNFWMARCSYIATLNDPWDPSYLVENVHRAINGWNFYPPLGRYRAEYWLLNDRGERPTNPIPINQLGATNVGANGRPSLLELNQVCSSSFSNVDGDQSANVVFVE